jgi:hypothetical protein
MINDDKVLAMLFLSICAFHKIENPIWYFQKECPKDHKIDGVACCNLAKNPYYYQDIAKDVRKLSDLMNDVLSLKAIFELSGHPVPTDAKIVYFNEWFWVTKDYTCAWRNGWNKKYITATIDSGMDKHADISDLSAFQYINNLPVEIVNDVKSKLLSLL